MLGSTRLAGVAGLFLILGWLASAAAAADPVWPSTHWAIVDDPAALGWSIEKLKKAEEYPRAYGATGVMIVQDGKIVATSGEVSHKANIRSARKSLLSALYSIGVAEGRIRLDQTLGELGIDDRPPGVSAAAVKSEVAQIPRTIAIAAGARQCRNSFTWFDISKPAPMSNGEFRAIG